eukprot:COSAG06_NODE_109_length_23526_cov_4.928843_4_plen_137_part_00
MSRAEPWVSAPGAETAPAATHTLRQLQLCPNRRTAVAHELRAPAAPRAERAEAAQVVAVARGPWADVGSGSDPLRLPVHGRQGKGRAARGPHRQLARRERQHGRRVFAAVERRSAAETEREAARDQAAAALPTSLV